MFRIHGWRKSLYLNPKYRQISSVYNFDDYSSKGSAVHPYKKYHRKQMLIDQMMNPQKQSKDHNGKVLLL